MNKLGDVYVLLYKTGFLYYMKTRCFFSHKLELELLCQVVHSTVYQCCLERCVLWNSFLPQGQGNGLLRAPKHCKWLLSPCQSLGIFICHFRSVSSLIWYFCF